MADLGDGLSLPVGEGGLGLGVTRNTGDGLDAIHERVPRNAPPVFAMGVEFFDTIFHDGRIERDPSMPSGIASPAGKNLPEGLDNVLAAQAMFSGNVWHGNGGPAGRKRDSGCCCRGQSSRI